MTTLSNIPRKRANGSVRLRLIAAVLTAVTFAGLAAPALAAKPSVTIGGLPSAIVPPQASAAAYPLSAYLNGAYQSGAAFAVTGGDAAGYSLGADGVLTVTPALYGTYFTVRCIAGGYTATQTVYVGARSITRNALAWVGGGWAEAGRGADKAVDGDSGTYWSAGNHSVGSNARLVIDTGGARYNRIKLEYPHLGNASKTAVYAADAMNSAIPEESGIGAAPVLASPVTVYSRAKPMYDSAQYLAIEDCSKRYLMFESTVEKASPAPPFQLSEISLFYAMSGDVRIGGAGKEIEIPRERDAEYTLSAALYDTTGQPIIGADYSGAWSVNAPRGAAFDGGSGKLTVSADAEEGEITAVFSATASDGVTLTAQKNIALVRGTITVYDDLSREVNGFARAGEYRAAGSYGGSGGKLLFAKYGANGALTAIAAANGGDGARLYIDPAVDAQVKAFCWDGANRPYARVWQPGGEIAKEKNVMLIEKSFCGGVTGTAGWYRVSGTVSAAAGLLTAVTDKNGIWTRLDRAAADSVVVETRLKANADAELDLKDAEGGELTYPIPASEELTDFTVLVNRVNNVYAANGGAAAPLGAFGAVAAVGIRANQNVTITMESLKCYTGLNANAVPARDYAYTDRTPADAGFAAARQNAENTVLLATDYDTALFYGHRVQLPRKPKDADGVLYVPSEAAALLGAEVLSQSGDTLTARLGVDGAAITLAVTDGYITAARFAELLGKNLYYADGVMTFASVQSAVNASDSKRVLYHARPTGGELLAAVNALDARPRVLANRAVIDRAAGNIAEHSAAAGWYAKILTAANGYLNKPPSHFQLDSSGKRLLNVSNEVSARMTSLGFVYQMTGDTRYAERAWLELEAAAAFLDPAYPNDPSRGWHPSHFLDVGEMCYAFAVGYDWFYGYFTEERKRVLVKAFEEKGLAPFVDAINNGGGWAAYDSNWNIWIRNGVLSCILSMGEDLTRPGAAAFALEQGIIGMENMFARFAPKGAWFEGTQYWEGTVRFIAQFIDTLENATGRYWGYDNLPGFEMTRYYSAMLTGSGGVFNFSDTTVKRDNPSVEFWLAGRYHDPGLMNLRLSNMQTYNLASSLLDLLWYVPTGTTELPSLPSDDILY
ncbi:MAG: hypothetical protein LBH54_00750, partial [Clostridiales bacterium]|nr:hypothetical protein [Clostridiales bacterium]